MAGDPLQRKGSSGSARKGQAFVLGIDVGTTSVKVCLVNVKSHEVTAKQAKDTCANRPPDVQGGDLQDPSKIYSALYACMARLPKEHLKRVVRIAICGQMHGVMFWKKGSGWRRNKREQIEMAETSPLFTWQDGRCSPEFLASLPQPDSHLRLATGYGVATIYWLHRNTPSFLEAFDYGATIMDFIVSMITEQDTDPITSVQNAASWGYFNTDQSTWNTELLEADGFPIQFLPRVLASGLDAGTLPSPWFDVPAGVPVSASLGDFQCSVRSTISAVDTDAVLNISTSAQIAFIKHEGFSVVDSKASKCTVEYFPYFKGRYMAVAASLNGGNVLAAFVKMIQQWVVELGLSIPQSKIWDKTIAAGVNCDPSQPLLDIIPLLYGERHCPETRAEVANIGPSNIALGPVMKSICKGIAQNLTVMMEPEMLHRAGINKIVGSGACLIRNPVLKAQVQELYQLPVEFASDGNACVGAALAIIDEYYPNRKRVKSTNSNASASTPEEAEGSP